MRYSCETKGIRMGYDSKIGRRRKMFAVSMSDFEMDILKSCAKEEECSMSELMRRALRDYYLGYRFF